MAYNRDKVVNSLLNDHNCYRQGRGGSWGERVCLLNATKKVEVIISLKVYFLMNCITYISGGESSFCLPLSIVARFCTFFFFIGVNGKYSVI